MQLTLAAATVVKDVVDNGKSLDMALQGVSADPGVSIPALKELSYGGCRFYTRYDAILSGLISRPLRKKDRIIHFLLISAMYQLDRMSIPDHAVVNETVKALKQTWAKNLINGVLRNYLRTSQKSGDAGISDLSSDCQRFSFPDYLCLLIKADWPDDYPVILNASNEKPPLTVRVNRAKLTRDQYTDRLRDSGIGFEPTSDSDIGVIFDYPVGVLDIPGFEAGEVSVQDESAQLVAQALAPANGMRVLDGCAAPGGKTGLLLEYNTDLAELVAVDLPHRIPAIHENLVRIGLPATVIESDLLDTERWWDQQFFDRILLDVPCSGSGVIRRHPDIRHRRKAGDIEKFHEQQVTLLRQTWPLLKPGGELLYVTCSIFALENDGSIEKFVGAIDDYELQSLDPVFGLETRFGRQRLPGLHPGDGFYYCKIRRVPR